jgi:hypothetical protein
MEAIEQDEFTPEPEPDDDDTSIADPEPDDDPVHLAKCAECATAVKFRPNVTGTGFFLVDADPDVTFGVGEHGRPVCPNGHGEMAIADDQLKPVAEAFADAQTMLLAAEADARGGAPVQGDLPGIIPPFNYQGCYLELEAKAAEVDALHDEYIDAKEVAADAKKAWDKAAELYTKMALEFRRRRQSKGDDSPSLAEPTSRALACTWDKAHPDEACPFCDTTLTIEQRAAIVRVIGEEILPTEANGHADQVVTYRTKLDVAETVDALAGLVYDVHDGDRGGVVTGRPRHRARLAGQPGRHVREPAGHPRLSAPRRESRRRGHGAGLRQLWRRAAHLAGRRRIDRVAARWRAGPHGLPGRRGRRAPLSRADAEGKAEPEECRRT